MKAVDTGMVNLDYENGKAMFTVSLCSACHTMRGEGGVAGPDLTQLGTRFSYKDMLESIIEPNKTISDQYGATVFYLKEGGSVVGRIITQDNDKYTISQNPFSPQTTRDVLKKDVQRNRISEVSPMLPGMINRLNDQELRNLLGYLKAGGDKNNALYTNKK
jgi:putative heme-binding domain-containing protein